MYIVYMYHGSIRLSRSSIASSTLTELLNGKRVVVWNTCPVTSPERLFPDRYI